MTPVHSMEKALRKAYDLLGREPAIYVIPYGSVLLPFCPKHTVAG